jgi:signal transduction histidine kinase
MQLAGHYSRQWKTTIYEGSVGRGGVSCRLFSDLPENIPQSARGTPSEDIPLAPHDQTKLADAWDTLRRYRAALALIVLITALHYNTSFHIHEAHGIYRRLYYLPIILAGFRGGVRGGLGAALLVCALYIPHAFGLIGFDPAHALEKSLEMVLYVAVVLLTGVLTGRINRARDRQASTAAALQRTLDEKTAMEAELVRSGRLAAVGRLSAGLAHEIRNPLASIRGAGEILSDDFPADHPKGRMLAVLRSETARLNEVLTRFLEFARREPGERRPFDLRAEAAAVVDLMATRPDMPPVTLDTPPDLPPALGNAQQIRQVLLNLVLNAGAAAGSAGRIGLVLSTADGRCLCAVHDDGPGFSQEAVAEFGTPFYSTREGGTGLGLATSLHIVENLGGTLAIDPAAPGGCVVLALPAAPSEGETP